MIFFWPNYIALVLPFCFNVIGIGWRFSTLVFPDKYKP